jgi:hypothetical protein
MKMTFETALVHLKQGKKIRRANDWWIDRNVCLQREFLLVQEVSGEDILAEDWEVVE